MISSTLNILCEYVSIIFVLKTVVIVNMILSHPLANPYLILWLLRLLYNQYQPIMSEAYLMHTCHQTCYEYCWRVFGHLGLSAWKIQLGELFYINSYRKQLIDGTIQTGTLYIYQSVSVLFSYSFKTFWHPLTSWATVSLWIKTVMLASNNTFQWWLEHIRAGSESTHIHLCSRQIELQTRQIQPTVPLRLMLGPLPFQLKVVLLILNQ